MNSQPTLTDCTWLDLNRLRGCSILITGATGLLGCNIIRELAAVADDYSIEILALVRNEARARIILSDFADSISFIVGDVAQPLTIDRQVDYVIHGASITSSTMFVQQPVETILTSVLGVRNMLELCVSQKVRAMVYLSSMEVYGSPAEPGLLSEADVDYLDPMKIRSSYPESKRLCETLCAAYAKEYGVNVSVARLAQTFGPGMQPDDRRAVVQFINSAIAGDNIDIKASGESARMYLYTFDAVSAIMTLLLKGQSGTAYNIANKDTYCSIKELAQLIVKLIGSDSSVNVNTGNAEELAIYPPDSFLRLDISRLEALGWSAGYTLSEGLESLIRAVRQ